MIDMATDPETPARIKFRATVRRKPRGFRRLADVINGIKFIDEIDEKTIERQRNAA